MKKYGTKIVAILVTVMCLIGISPLLVNAATEEIYHPAVVTITNEMRYSYSGGAYVQAAGRACITIPFVNEDNSIIISFNQPINNHIAVLIIDEQRTSFYQFNKTLPTDKITINGLSLNKGYIVINDDQSGVLFPSDIEISIDGNPATVVFGPYTEAEFPYYETIEIPDPPQSNDIATNILDMWHNIISQNSHNLTQFYDDLTGGIALLLGVPIVLAIIAIIFRMLGGRK